MSNENGKKTELVWEWPANRSPQRTFIVKVENIKNYKAGLFGLKQSPSIASSLPDPKYLSGKIIAETNKTLKGREIGIVMPALEISGVSTGDLINLGLLNEDIAICASKLDSKLTDSELTDLVKNPTCKKE